MFVRVTREVAVAGRWSGAGRLEYTQTLFISNYNMSRRQGKPRQANTLQAKLQQAKEDVIPAKNEPPSVAAKEFKLQEVICAFGLKRVEDLVQVPGQLKSLKWDIQKIPETKGFVLTPFLRKSFVHSDTPPI